MTKPKMHSANVHIKQDRPVQATFDLINHIQQSKGGKRGGERDKHTSLQPDQSLTKEDDGEMKKESWRLFTLSIMSGRLVAASTVTSRSCSMPSISVRSWARTRSPTPLEPEELKGRVRTEDTWMEGDGSRDKSDVWTHDWKKDERAGKGCR